MFITAIGFLEHAAIDDAQLLKESGDPTDEFKFNPP